MNPDSICAVIPVKSFVQAKSRLSSCLEDRARESLAKAMLEDLLDAVSSVNNIDSVLIVSSDPQAQAIADTYKAELLHEAIDTGLNSALEKAASYLLSKGVTQMLVLPADLPLISAADICTLLNVGNKSSLNNSDRDLSVPTMQPKLVLVGARNSGGTNAMLVSPVDLISFRYGEQSYRDHLEQGIALGADVVQPELPGFLLDVDTQEDLQYLLSNQHQLNRGSRTLNWINHFSGSFINHPADRAITGTAELGG